MEISQSKPAADLGTWIIFDDGRNNFDGVCVLIPLWTDWVLYYGRPNGSLLIGLSNILDINSGIDRIFDGIQN